MANLPRLNVYGTLNYERLEKMSDDECRNFVQEHVKDLLGGKPESHGSSIIKEDDKKVYEVRADYTIIDIHYNEQGHLLALLTCRQKDGEVTVMLKTVKYEPMKRIFA